MPLNVAELNVRCLLATITTRGQVSVYAPTADPYTTPWAQVSLAPRADIGALLTPAR